MPGSDYINLKTLSLDELAGVVNMYPWYGAAHKVLCQMMSRMGKDAWGREQYADAALYVADRSLVADIFRTGEKEDLSDKELEQVLKSLLDSVSGQEESARAVHVVGGDYFTQAQYDNVRTQEDNVFSKFAARVSMEGKSEKEVAPLVDDDFCTEPMAQIYAEQGYLEQATHIYSRLLLKFPEKSAYFAALMKNLTGKEE